MLANVQTACNIYLTQSVSINYLRSVSHQQWNYLIFLPKHI